jgi:hypothetical protein
MAMPASGMGRVTKTFIGDLRAGRRG